MKKILAVLLLLCMAFSLVACGGDVASTDSEGGNTSTNSGANASSDRPSDSSSDGSSDVVTDSITDGGSVTDSVTGPTSTDVVVPPTSNAAPNLVMATDQLQGRLVIYDFDRYKEGDTLEDLEVWSVKTGHAAGLKYREDTVLGDVVLVGGSTSYIFEYPSGKVLWSTPNPGSNTHSVELLPSGNIVFANSSGKCLRLFQTCILADPDSVESGQAFTDYELYDAHGVLWDPEYEVLWALGGKELRAYKVEGEGENETLVQVEGMGMEFSKETPNGHDLSPDYTDSRYLYITLDTGVYRFDKKTNELIEDIDNKDLLSGNYIKGFSNNQNGNFFSSIATGGAGLSWENWANASWCTALINYFYYDDSGVLQKVSVAAEESAYYKVRAFCGAYQ